MYRLEKAIRVIESEYTTHRNVCMTRLYLPINTLQTTQFQMGSYLSEKTSQSDPHIQILHPKAIRYSEYNFLLSPPSVVLTQMGCSNSSI